MNMSPGPWSSGAPAGFPNRDRAQWTISLLQVNIGLAVISVLTEAYRLSVLSRSPLPSNALQVNTQLRDVLNGVQSAVFLGTILAFLLWWHRSLVNMKVAGRPVSDTPGWAVGMWFVPIVNLYRPFQLVREAATDQHGRQAPFLVVWWVCWLIVLFSTTTEATSSMTLTQLSRDSAVTLFANLAAGLSAYFLLGIVHFIQRRQDRLLTSTSPDPASRSPYA